MLLAAILSYSSAACGGDQPSNRFNRGENARGVRSGAILFQSTSAMIVNGASVSLDLGIVGELQLDEKNFDIPGWQIVPIDAFSFDEFMFGGDHEGRLKQLDELLEQELSAIERVVSLTTEQRKKLGLAGRADIRRLLARVESLRSDFEHPRMVEGEVMDHAIRQISVSMQEARKLQEEIVRGPFGKDSFFKRNLRRIVTMADYDRILEDRENVGHSSK